MGCMFLSAAQNLHTICPEHGHSGSRVHAPEFNLSNCGTPTLRHMPDSGRTHV